METPYSQFVCIGAGFSGIALGATLKRWYGITDVVLLEKSPSLGGTWQWNRYPGAACDVPSALYSFSFERNPNWTRFLPPGQELREYLIKVAAKYDLLSKMRFRTEVVRAEWVEDRARWRVHWKRWNGDHDGSSDDDDDYDDVGGQEKMGVIECQFLYTGTGHLARQNAACCRYVLLVTKNFTGKKCDWKGKKI